jgi:hypothetical protein
MDKAGPVTNGTVADYKHRAAFSGNPKPFFASIFSIKSDR